METEPPRVGIERHHGSTRRRRRRRAGGRGWCGRRPGRRRRSRRRFDRRGVGRPRCRRARLCRAVTRHGDGEHRRERHEIRLGEQVSASKRFRRRERALVAVVHLIPANVREDFWGQRLTARQAEPVVGAYTPKTLHISAVCTASPKPSATGPSFMTSHSQSIVSPAFRLTMPL